MMKRIWATVWATCMALTAALALAQTSEEIALAAYPSCTVKTSASGNGFDAFALGNGEKTALCIVENGVLTVANERLFETGQGIQVFVDTDGESLFLDYDTEYARVSLHAVYRNGAWSDADVTCFEQNESGGVPTYPETHWYAEGGLLHVRYAVYDENENEQTGSRIEYEISVGTDFDMSLGGIDMTRFPKSVEQLDTTYDAFPTGLAAPLLDEGDTLLQIGVYPAYTVLLLQSSDGGRRVRVSERNGRANVWRDSVTLDSSATLDLFHAGGNQIFLEEKGREFFFRRTRRGDWLLTGSMGEELLNLGVDCVPVDEIYGVGLNDGYIYGGSEPLDLMKTPVDQWPTTRKQAVARLDTDAYAFVNNDNPADRLHLREAPNRNARSLGKFYNRTPVKMIAWEGDWAYVEIGTGEAHLYGYMMTKYLTRGGDKGVRCAFEILTPIEEIGQDGAPIYREPDDTMEEIGRFVGGDEYVIGVYGDDWVIVLTWDGNVGYVRRADVWEGNGLERRSQVLLRSLICVGGALRDGERWGFALSLGNSHSRASAPYDFRFSPCSFPAQRAHSENPPAGNGVPRAFRLLRKVLRIRSIAKTPAVQSNTAGAVFGKITFPLYRRNTH